MTSELDLEGFQDSVALAFKGVLEVYGEADALLRELRGLLSETFDPLVERLVPTPGQQGPDARYLRGYVATVFAPGAATQSPSADDNDDDAEDDEDDDDDGDGGKAKRPLVVTAGSGLMIARVALYGSKLGGDLPKLTIHHLSNCNATDPVEPGTPIRVARPRWFGRVLRALDAPHSARQPLDTMAKVFIPAVPKPRRSKLTVIPSVLRTTPLFEIDTHKLAEIAKEIRSTWSG